jgi:Restriction endonuclease
MSTNEQSADVRFERQIERIHRLIETEDSDVTWNDRIPDPDNPSRLRQIDITIRRDGRLTVVECRIHKEAQDVTWIEELIGRRASLRADAIIAVSASGFTSGAKAKAQNFGIILRSLDTLTAEEIRDWGKERRVDLVFYEFCNLTVTFRLPLNELDTPISITNTDGSPISWRTLFEAGMTTFDEEAWDGSLIGFETELFGSITVNGVTPSSMTIGGDVRRLIQEVHLASIVVYSDPAAAGDADHALIAKYELGSSEIIEASEEVSFVVDLSHIEIPPQYLFRRVLFDFGRVVTMRGCQFIGLREALWYKNSIRFRFEFV